MPVMNQTNEFAAQQENAGRIYHEIGGKTFGIEVTLQEMNELKKISSNPDALDVAFKSMLKEKNPEAYKKAMALEPDNLAEQIKGTMQGARKDADKSIDRAMAMASANFDEAMKSMQGMDNTALHR